MSWAKLFYLFGNVGIILTVCSMWGVFNSNTDVLSILSVVVLVKCILCTIICFDISRRRPSDSQSFRFIAGWYFLVAFIIPIVGWWRYRSLDRASKCVEKTQNSLLKKVIRTASDTKYGVEHGFRNIASVDEFINSQPLTTYIDYKPYVDYMFETGDLKDVTFKGKVVYYAATSGTTGNNKIFPISDKHIRNFVVEFVMVIYRAMKTFPAYSHLNSPFGFRIVPTFKMSPQGIRIGPVSASRDSTSYVPSRINQAASLASEETALYIHALLVLQKRDTEVFVFMFPASAKLFIQLIESNWRQLCTDIERGESWSALPLAADIKAELNTLLQPNPKRADELRRQFELGFQDIIPRLWPNASCISLLSSGSFKLRADMLKRQYFGGVPVISQGYGGTEGPVASLTFVIDKTEGNYTPLADSIFLEFIPVDRILEDQPPTKRLHQLELDNEYEVVMTNDRGVYRYRNGDVIKVVGYYNELPLIDLSYRSGQILNVANEKLTETAMADGLNIATDILGISITDYTGVEGPIFEEATKDISAVRSEECNGLYEVLFIEFTSSEGNAERKLQREDINKIDESLMEAHENYRAKRTQDILQPMRVYQVKEGTFLRFRKMVLSSNPLTSATQFKQPRSLSKQEHIRYFIENAVF